MKRLAHKVIGVVKNPKKVAKLTGKQFYILFRFGPVEYSEYLKRAVTKHIFIHNFPNGIKTSLDNKKAKNWYLLNKKALVVVLLNEPKTDISEWASQLYGQTKCHILLNAATKNNVSSVDEEIYTILDELSEKDTSFFKIKQYIQQQHRGKDIFFIDLKNPLIDPFDVIRLQHAAYSYDEDREIGFVAPSYKYKDEIIAGYEYNRIKREWSACGRTKTDYKQSGVPRYSLTAFAHGLYITHHTIQRLSARPQELLYNNLDLQISYLVMKGWKQNIRTLTFSPVVAEVTTLSKPEITTEHTEWLENRYIVNENGDRKVIYVLNATSVSGGIRVIFEHANGLVKRGFDVEIWSLQGQPTWTDLDITVKKFRTYSDLLLSLRNEDAIKVATWWETDQIVWLASVNHGVPVNFIQEFETWFYPDDPIARAAVVSSYRKEFVYMTTAEYQREELRSIGVESPIIPVGYEQKYYHQDDSIERQDDVVLALGRSFFQKNFAMTARAWRSIGSSRPRLFLFGSEPDILKDEKVTYYFKPSNEEVNKLYNQATCFVQTSRHEGFSLPIIEAMAAGCPVITTDSHGNRGFCHHEKNCLIIEQDDDRSLAEAITRLINDKALQEKFRCAGLETAKKYEWSGILDSLADFYRKLG